MDSLFNVEQPRNIRVEIDLNKLSPDAGPGGPESRNLGPRTNLDNEKQASSL